MNQTVVIGIGAKARQGKDYFSKYMKEIGLPDVEIHIIHFADALYEEARNEGNDFPLLTSDFMLASKYIIINLNANDERAIPAKLLPRINEFLLKRDIYEFRGMVDKDSEFLQIWGTDIRRNLYDQDYWVKKTEQKILEIKKLPGKHLILIPDTRFKNELLLITKHNGFYVEVIRLNEDGTRFLATDRDPNHPSEIDLDGTMPTWQVICKSGQLDLLKDRANIVLDFIRQESFEREG